MKDVFLYTMPALIVLAATWVVMYKLFRNEQQKREWELKKLSQKEITPIRLRAYERLALLLERTTPEHILSEINVAEMTVLELQQHLLRTILAEFDHNLSQQIYVSNELWDQIINARDQMGAFVAAIAKQLPEASTSTDYARLLISAYRSNGDTPHQLAMDALKTEAMRLLTL